MVLIETYKNVGYAIKRIRIPSSLKTLPCGMQLISNKISLKSALMEKNKYSYENGWELRKVMSLIVADTMMQVPRVMKAFCVTTLLREGLARAYNYITLICSGTFCYWKCCIVLKD